VIERRERTMERGVTENAREIEEGGEGEE